MLWQALLIRALQWVAQAAPGQPMHLLVLADNTAARRFSVRHGGVRVEALTRYLFRLTAEHAEERRGCAFYTLCASPRPLR